MRITIIIFLALVSSIQLLAQPSNDDCIDAIIIPTTDDYCSDPMAFSNVGATPDPVTQVAIDECTFIEFMSGVWFSFIPEEPAALISANSGQPLGTAARLRAVLYDGSCTTGLSYVGCSPGNASFVEYTITDLTVGQRYYLYIESDPDFTGTFQLCINSFIAPPSPQSDCPEGVVLCDKSGFQVESLQTSGELENELAEFVGSCLDTEFASSWYKWTCDDPGTLSFTLTPNDYRPGFESDDLDFALFELPNGLDDCSNKEMLRCMASGETGGCDPSIWWTNCNGPTGLNDASGDISEDAGCNRCVGGDDDNFASSIIMESGKSYALVVMNFSRTGKGFDIEFGGTGTFLGPEPDFTEILGNFLECDKTVEYFDASAPGPDPIISWEWNFGNGANPQRATDIGPHETIYESFGPKSVALTVESTRGCRVTTILDIFVEACCDDLPDIFVVADTIGVSCAGDTDGSFTLEGSNGVPEYNFSIDGGPFVPSINYDNLAPGEYIIRAVDQKGCEATTIAIISEPEPLIVDAGLDLEIDLGFQDTLNATIEPAGANVTYMWNPEEGLDCPESDFVDCPDPIVISPGTTTYVVTITDTNGCTSTDAVTVSTNIIRPIYAPNVITPDTRDRESIFKLGFGRQVDIVTEFYIYDRWGNQIFIGTNIEIDGNNEMVSGWNGRFGRPGDLSSEEVNPGVYVWLAQVRFIDGVTLPFTGDVMVIK